MASLVPIGTVARAASTPIIASPAPGSVTASVTTQIGLLGASAASLGAITVTGSTTGRHAGTMRRYASAPGESLVPSTSFAAGESVTIDVGRPTGSVGPLVVDSTGATVWSDPTPNDQIWYRPLPEMSRRAAGRTSGA